MAVNAQTYILTKRVADRRTGWRTFYASFRADAQKKLPIGRERRIQTYEQVMREKKREHTDRLSGKWTNRQRNANGYFFSDIIFGKVLEMMSILLQQNMKAFPDTLPPLL